MEFGVESAVKQSSVDDTSARRGSAVPDARTVLFFERFFYPEGWGGAELPRDLTMHLAQRGIDVEVICGADQYVPVEGSAGPDPRSAGLRIRRVPALLAGDIHAMKMLRQFWFYLAVTPVLFLRRRPALLILQTNPPLGVVMCALASRIWRRPLVVIAMDIYPEVLIAHGSLAQGGFFATLLSNVFCWAYRTATRVVVLGPVMRERLLAKGVTDARIVEIPNWSTGAPGIVRGHGNRLGREWGVEGRFVVVYSGNLGIGHEFETFLNGFSAASEVLPDLHLLIIGKGSRLEEVRKAVVKLGLSNRVCFKGFVLAEQLPESFGLADVALITLRPGFEGLIVPSKLYGYMSRGVPVLYVGPRSDTDIAISDARCGIVLRTGDELGVRNTLLTMHSDRQLLRSMGEAGRAAYEAGLTSAHALAKYDALVDYCLVGG